MMCVEVELLLLGINVFSGACPKLLAPGTHSTRSSIFDVMNSDKFCDVNFFGKGFKRTGNSGPKLEHEKGNKSEKG